MMVLFIKYVIVTQIREKMVPLEEIINFLCLSLIQVKVKLSRYTPWRRLGGEEV
jgi:hypothetical protein